MAAEKRDLKQSYLAQEADLMPFVAWPWPLQDFQPLIDARAAIDSPRDILVQELQAQNQHLPSATFTLAEIAKLRSPKTFTVTTGHQVCLMGGPMFTLYKIATTIALSQQLKAQYPDYEFVPLLWMATEDHDWEEVNHFFTGFNEKIVYPGSFRGPVGRHVLQDSIAQILPEGIPAALRAFYAPGKTMAEAFRSLMHHLFGRHGLVILDADRPALKDLFAPTVQKELLGNAVAKPVKATTVALENLGFKAQIMPRDINLFYLGEGGRSLIDAIDGGFKLKDGPKTWTETDILAELASAPQNFSPNVALRPVYQEILLPNLAYIGGWAEVSYWMQLKAGFEAVGGPFPLLVPRLHATLFTAAQALEFQELGFVLSDIVQPLHLLNDQYLLQNWSPAPIEAAISDVDQAFERLAAMMEGIDPTLATGIRAEQTRSNNAFETLQKKVRKSLRNRNPLPYQRIAALKNAIEPENASQQRVLNFTAFDAIHPLTLVEVIVKHALNTKSEAKWITLP